jgi:Domain of unknown function (DUF4112)
VADPARALGRYRLLAHALDARWRIPGTGIRFGWDAVMGLVPGVGDALGGLLGGYGLYVGWRLGAPVVVLARMLLNLGIETVAGTVPLAGDMFDIGFRADLRNVALLDRWLEQPHQTWKRSRWLFLGLALGLLTVVVGVIGLTASLLHTLLALGR